MKNLYADGMILACPPFPDCGEEGLLRKPFVNSDRKTYTVMSKRKLLQRVNEKFVRGWDDPRMPTISGLRRRGFTPKAIREFCERVGIARRENVIDVGLLEYCLREDLNKRAVRRMAVLDPVKLVITNYEEGKEEIFMSENNPEQPNTGTREIPFSKELWIEREDFME